MAASAHGDPDAVEGLVERVLYRDEISGYAICRIVTSPPAQGSSSSSPRSTPGKTCSPSTSGAGSVTVTGRFASIQPGERISCRGQWIHHPGYGLQFQASHTETQLPASLAGIERYLGSGLIDGIGPAYAARIVRKFGQEVFTVLDKSSRRLEEVDGIGPKRRREIKKSWEEQKSVRRIMLFLHEHGVSTSRAIRIHRHYGEEAENILRSNPFQLARDVPGFGFRTADAISRQLGLPAEAPSRLEAGLFHLLEEAQNQGHCGLPRSTLLERAAALLEAPSEALDSALSGLETAGDPVTETIRGETLVFPRFLRESEKRSAQRIRALGEEAPSLPSVHLERALEWCRKRTGQTLDSRQAQAVAQVLSTRVSIITGGPGVGKTTVLRTLLFILQAKKVATVLCAPTGRAARRMQESTGQPAHTLHRLLEYQPETGFTRSQDHPLEGDLFVVDEFSMVDLPLFHHFLQALPARAHLLLAGDPDQLPSVGPGAVLSDLLQSGAVPVVRLTTVFRQSRESSILDAAAAINRGHLPDLPRNVRRPGSDFFFIERDEPGAILQTLATVLRERLPRRRFDPLRDAQVLTPVNRGPLGTASLNTELQRLLNPPGEHAPESSQGGRIFRVGDRVIQVRNNYERDVCNGDLGQVVSIETGPFRMSVAFDGERRLDYDSASLDEIRHAYAITIHKSQGSEFPAVLVILSTAHAHMLRRNLLYTAVTRARSLVILLGNRRALELAAQRADDRRRITGLQSLLENGGAQSGDE
ncbi:MAG TPA: ATP-dependent RecD-like DNA helicase [Verrucomicrobiales bacterium]|nr:ATP-dependent RecD-like DNA helicase [Verrucomicrobiales bacterium]